ncbi:MAG: hypothetical protein J2P57_03215, partial [Acidimicrobiaceae bacterium]|nr:hypothetical protein [Acidimicrobiaceae bacterium]
MGAFTLGALTSTPASQHEASLASATFAALKRLGWLDRVGVVPIDPDVSDTAKSQETYRLPPA